MGEAFSLEGLGCLGVYDTRTNGNGYPMIALELVCRRLSLVSAINTLILDYCQFSCTGVEHCILLIWFMAWVFFPPGEWGQ